MKPGREKDKLEQRLKDLDTRWNELSDKIKERSEKLQEVEPSASKYLDCSEPFTTWLSESEERLKDCEKIPEDEESAAQQLELLEVGFVSKYNKKLCWPILFYLHNPLSVNETSLYVKV